MRLDVVTSAAVDTGVRVSLSGLCLDMCPGMGSQGTWQLGS